MKKSNIRIIDYCLYNTDKDFYITNIDEKFTKLTGYTKEDIKKHTITLFDLLPEEDREEYMNIVKEHISKSHEAYIEHRLLKKNKEIIFVFCMGILNDDGTSQIRITEMDNSLSLLFLEKNLKLRYTNRIKNIKKLAETDNLTNLLRRSPLIKKTNKLLKQNQHISLLLIDVDDFKNINDSYGHTTGDTVLKEIANLLIESTTEKDLICRMGGDEFAILITNEESPEEIANNLLNGVKKIKISKDNKYKIGLSIGIKEIIKNDNFKFEDVYYLADKALYKAKKNGKNQYCKQK